MVQKNIKLNSNMLEFQISHILFLTSFISILSHRVKLLLLFIKNQDVILDFSFTNILKSGIPVWWIMLGCNIDTDYVCYVSRLKTPAHHQPFSIHISVCIVCNYILFLLYTLHPYIYMFHLCLLFQNKLYGCLCEIFVNKIRDISE